MIDWTRSSSNSFSFHQHQSFWFISIKKHKYFFYSPRLCWRLLITYESFPRRSKSETDFIEFSINSKTKTLGGLCYDRSPQLKKFKDENKSCLILQAELSKSDIIIGHETIIKSKEVDFKNKTHDPPTVTMEQVINECPLYQKTSGAAQLLGEV